MFRGFLYNTAVSLVAYSAISIIGLIVVPVLISAYGLGLYGLIMLARLWLPTGILGLLDLGVGETATLLVARARSTSEWEWAGGKIAWLGLFAAGIGAAGGLALCAVGEMLGRLLGVPPEHSQEFVAILRWTAAALPLLFVSLVAEGIVKGFEEYSAARMIEVLSSLIYGIGSIMIVWLGGSYAYVAYMAVASGVFRAGVSMLTAGYFLKRSSLRVEHWRRFGPAECWRQMRLMAANKVLSTLQVQAAPGLVGVLVGPAGLGVYDVLVRLPRFAKSILGLVNSALLPFAARLEAGNHTADLRRLGAVGLPLVAAITMPPLMAAATFSQPILLFWIGPSFVGYWHWQSMMFFVPIMTVLVSFGATALFSRRTVPGRMNRMLAAQLCLQLVISVALVKYFQERAFILGQVVAMATTFYWQLRLVFQEQQLGISVIRHLVSVAGIGFLLSAAYLPFVPDIGSVWQLGTVAGTYMVAYFLLIWWMLPDRATRGQILHHLVRRTDN